MEKVASKDGTLIAYHKSGSGAPLVLVHGAGGSIARWTPVLPGLGTRLAVYPIDRRGRGESSDAKAYAIEREFEDVAAVVDSIGQPTSLLGHSFGGICALEAALLTENIDKLILYEPPIPLTEFQIYPDGVIDRLEKLLATGDPEKLFATFMEEVVRMPPHELQLLRLSPVWPARVAAAHTIPRELRAHERYRFDATRFKGLNTPTLLLVGGDSPEFFRAAIEAVHVSLLNSRIIDLPGQRHNAIDVDPDLFVREVLAFMAGSI